MTEPNELLNTHVDFIGNNLTEVFQLTIVGPI